MVSSVDVSVSAVRAGGHSLTGMQVFPGSPGSQGIHVGVLSGTQDPVGDGWPISRPCVSLSISPSGIVAVSHNGSFGFWVQST